MRILRARNISPRFCQAKGTIAIGFLLRVALGFALLLNVVVGASETEESFLGGRQERRPFFRLRDNATLYFGPGREVEEPADVNEVRLGFFGPATQEDPKAGTIWAGCVLALEQIQTVQLAGGKKPLRLLSYWSPNPWMGAVTQLARGVYEDGIWVVIGGIDGETTHLAAQVAAKALIAIVSPGNTDKTSHLANVPWVFSVLPGDDLLAQLLAEHWLAKGLHREVVLLSASDHDSRRFSVELMQKLAGVGGGVRFRADFKPGTSALEGAVEEVLRMDPPCIMISADAQEAARAVRLLRKAGYMRTLYGGPTFGQRMFQIGVGEDPGEVIFPFCWRKTSRTLEFVTAFQLRYGFPPDYLAAAGFDAVSICAAAIEVAGLNRARINDALRQLSPWQGVSGEIRWDKAGMNLSTPCLARFRDGHLEVQSAPNRWELFFGQ
jgi:branched-chain amino acid transport system substrate-binding protein